MEAKLLKSFEGYNEQLSLNVMENNINLDAVRINYMQILVDINMMKEAV